MECPVSYGCRVQKSVFELSIVPAQLTQLINDLKRIINPLPPIKKERKVPMAYLDLLCTLVDSMGVKDLCRRIKESDDGDTRILPPEEFQVIIKHRGVEIFYLFNRLNYKALHEKQVIQEIKSILYDIELFFNTVLDMSDEQLMKNGARVAKIAADYFSLETGK